MERMIIGEGGWKRTPAFDERIRTWLSQNGGLRSIYKGINFRCIMDF